MDPYSAYAYSPQSKVKEKTNDNSKNRTINNSINSVNQTQDIYNQNKSQNKAKEKGIYISEQNNTDIQYMKSSEQQNLQNQHINTQKYHTKQQIHTQYREDVTQQSSGSSYPHSQNTSSIGQNGRHAKQQQQQQQQQQPLKQHSSSSSIDRKGITDLQQVGGTHTHIGNQMNPKKKGDRESTYSNGNSVNSGKKNTSSYNSNNENAVSNTGATTSYSSLPLSKNPNSYIYVDYNPYTYPNIGFFGERYKDKDGHIITDPNTIEEGYLRKRGIRISSIFSERYFVLKDDKIFYYQKENDLLAKGAYVLNKSCLVSQVKVHTQTHSYHKNKKLYIFSVSWPMAIETTEEYVPGSGTSRMVLEDGTRSTSMLSTSMLGYNGVEGDKENGDKQQQQREKRSSTFLSKRSNRRASDGDKGSIDSVNGLESHRSISSGTIGDTFSGPNNENEPTWGNSQSTATIKVIQSYFMNMSTSESTNSPGTDVDHQSQVVLPNQGPSYPNSDPNNPNAPKSTTKQDKTDYTAAKVAALAVGGVVVGTLTAGVIPLAGLMIVGFSAAAGGGGAAFLSSTSKDNKPKPITLTLASESEFTAKSWFSSIEYQIRLLRTVPEGYKGSLLSWTQANGFGIDVEGSLREDTSGSSASNRLAGNESNSKLSMQLLLPIHQNIKAAGVPPKATNLKLVSFWTSPALSLWRPVNGSLLGGDGVRIYELVRLQTDAADKSLVHGNASKIVNYADDVPNKMTVDTQNLRNNRNDGTNQHSPGNSTNSSSLHTGSDSIDSLAASKSPRRTRKEKRGRLNPRSLRTSNSNETISHNGNSKDDSGEDLRNSFSNCRKIQVPVKCSALDAFVAIISNPSKLVSHHPPNFPQKVDSKANSSSSAVPFQAVGCGSIKSIRVIERIDDNADIIHMVLHPLFLWPTWISPRDFCLVRYWRYYKDGTYLVCYNSTVHRGCPQLDDTMRCEMSAAYIISPRKSPGSSKKFTTPLNYNLSTSQRYKHLHQYPSSLYGYDNGGSQIHDGNNECLLTYIVQSDPNGWLWRTGGYIDRFINEILMQALDLRDMLEREAYQSIDILSSEDAEQEHVVETPSSRKQSFRVTNGARSLSVSSTNSQQRTEEGVLDAQNQGYQSQLASRTSTTREETSENGMTSKDLEMINSPKNVLDVPVNIQEEEEDDILAYPTLRNHNPTCPEEMWEDILGDDFNVRGPSYHLDRVKIQSPEAAFECVAVDLFHLDKPMNNICAHPNNRIQAAARNGDAPPFTWAIQLQIPGSGAFPHFGYVVYLTPKDPNIFDESRPLTPLTRLLKSFFFEKDDKWRDKRFKLIPRIVDGPWVVRKAVGNTPAILGTKLKQYYYQRPNYFELDVAIESSMAAANIVKLAGSYSKALIVDLAVLIQGDTEEELPEQVVGSWSICKLDLTLAKRI